MNKETPVTAQKDENALRVRRILADTVPVRNARSLTAATRTLTSNRREATSRSRKRISSQPFRLPAPPSKTAPHPVESEGANLKINLRRGPKRLSWFEKKIRDYEKMRFDQEPNRRSLPFAWGIEHIGGEVNDPDPRGYLEEFVPRTIATSDEWFAATPADDYALDEKENVLTFTSQLESPWRENNRVHAQFFPVGRKRAAVVVLAQWNAKWDEQLGVCRYLNKCGITALKVSLPYHDRRVIPGHPRADHLVGPNIGLTMQANRQAVLDVKRALRWLESRGYDQLGVVGTSIGSCIGFITMCHEPAIRAGVFLHVSTYFGEVVSQGLTTVNVWDSMKAHVSREEATHYWSPISPFRYVPKLRGTSKKMLAITGKYDPTFWPELTNQFLDELRRNDVPFQHMSLPCGHYSLGVAPFSYAVGYRFGSFLKNALS